jgi:PelA/Pel-15E family pectate lyase
LQLRSARLSSAVAATLAAALGLAGRQHASAQTPQPKPPAASVQPSQPKPLAAPDAAPVKWSDGLRQRPEWYATDEAARVADNLLAYQSDEGGWDKNIDMAALLPAAKLAELVRNRKNVHPTIDNGATYTQLAYLARVFAARGQERHREAFFRGFDYLLRAQYANGGWPQYFPLREGYYSHITYNDNAMIGVMKLMRDAAKGKAPYAFVDAERRAKAARGVERGVECILKTQVVVAGKRTVWCAQHDEVTFAPAPARKFEPVSLTGLESVEIVRFLMKYERQDARVVGAVESAVEWFRAAQLSGVRWVERRDPKQPGGYERAAVADPTAPPIWARFYELGTNRPIFLGRRGALQRRRDRVRAAQRLPLVHGRAGGAAR